MPLGVRRFVRRVRGVDRGVITADEALEFCKKYYRKDGRPFSLEGREWVRDELFEPALGWKVWPRDEANLCEKCAKEVGKIISWSPEAVRKYKRVKRCCAGLKLEKITVVVLNLQRGAGKTTNTTALVTALITKVPKVKVSFIASAGAQARTIAQENIIEAVRSNPKLTRLFELKGNKLTFHRKHERSSFFEILDSSAGSAAGRRRSFLFFDEGRDIRSSVLTHMLPSVNAQTRFECPNAGSVNSGHDPKTYAPDTVEKCDTCGAAMLPSVPIVVITSTSGMRTGGDKDWFDEMVEMLADTPRANTHLYRSAEASNPDANELEQNLVATFRGVPSLQDLMDAEIDNIPMVSGQGLAEPAEIRACIDPTLAQTYVSTLPTVGFLDTSTVADLTSLVLLSEDPDTDVPWGIVRLSHVSYWDPKEVQGRMITEDLIMPALAQVLSGFPNLIELRVDTRGSGRKFKTTRESRAVQDWPSEMMRKIEDGDAPRELLAIKPKIKGFRGLFKTYNTKEQRAAAWAQLEQRIMSRRIKLFRHPVLERELRGVQKHYGPSGLLEVKDRARHRSHADVADSLAMCCFMAWKLTRGDEGGADRVSALVKQFALSGGLTRNVSEVDF